MGAYNKCFDSRESEHNQLYSGEYILLDLSLSVLPIPSEDPRRQSIPSMDPKTIAEGFQEVWVHITSALIVGSPNIINCTQVNIYCLI